MENKTKKIDSILQGVYENKLKNKTKELQKNFDLRLANVYKLQEAKRNGNSKITQKRV